MPFAVRAADGGRADLRLGAGVEILHRSGTAVASLKVRALNAMLWNGNAGVGLTASLGSSVGWSGGIGGIAVARTEGPVGTHLNFLFRGSYCDEKRCFTAVHISHGTIFGIETGKSNSGLNFLMLEYRH